MSRRELLRTGGGDRRTVRHIVIGLAALLVVAIGWMTFGGPSGAPTAKAAAQTAAGEVQDRRELIAGDEETETEEGPAETMLREMIATSDLDADQREAFLADLDATDGPLDRLALEARIRAALVD